MLGQARQSHRLAPRICFIFGTILALIFALIFPLNATQPLRAQQNFQDVIEMDVEAGFDSFFRPRQWTPVRVELTNNGDSVKGRLVIRPETSGTVVGNAFSAAIDLPTGARKSATLYIQARTWPDSVRVELIADDGIIHAARDARLYDLGPADQLYAVVSGPNVSVPNLSSVHVGGAVAEQAHWQIHEIPEKALALDALDAMLLINVSSDSLSSAQRQAMRRWVQGGGHLIVAGGPAAQASAAALGEMLPLQPGDSRSLDDISALARFAGDASSQLQARTVAAIGAAHEDARILVEQDGTPLLARRRLGLGLVDFLAVDPTLEPLASWPGINRLWLSILGSREPQPTWVAGFTRPESAAEAVANLPGVDLLPPLQTLCLFLALYIAFVGPINYFILSRFKRSGWGWVTIPLVIAVFTGIAWTVGFSLRGAEIIVSRLGVVQTFPDSGEARVDQVIGLLSPRRATYSLDVPAGHSLAVAGASKPSALFASNTIQTATEIEQGGRFGARDFTIDGGIFANFAIGGFIPRPEIGGSFALDFELLENGRMAGSYQGFIRNDSDITLRDAVILGHGLAYHLVGDFAPGDLLALDGQTLRANSADYPMQPNPLELMLTTLDYSSSPFSGSKANISLKQIQGERFLRTRAFLNVQSVAEKQMAREQSFLASFALDQFNSTARGTKLYLAGWQDRWARDLEIAGAPWNSVDTTLYLIELAVEINLPAARATLPSEYFSWMTLSREGIRGNGADDFNLYEGQSVEFLFSPQPGLAMDQVERLFLEIDRGGGYAQSLDIELLNTKTQQYEVFGYREGDELELLNPERYLGANNAVQIRLNFDEGLGTARVRQIRIEQTGAYSAN